LVDNETKRTVASLKTLRNTLGFWPKLVFDRNFGGQGIVKFLTAQEATFTFVSKPAGSSRYPGNSYE